jgi:hypothetical protein
MDAPSPRNFFALLDNFDLRLLSLTDDLQRELTPFFERQRDEFFAEYPDRMPFEADYTPDEGEAQFIESFKVPQNLAEGLKSPLTVNPLLGEELSRIRGLFTGDVNGQEILFQIFDRRRLFSNQGFSLTVDRGTFRKLTDEGLTLDTKLAAAVQEGRLYFHSFALARRLFDLSSYFREATDADLDHFAIHEAVLFDNPASLRSNADSWVRRKVALILQSRVLDEERPAKIAVEAQDFGLIFHLQTVNGEEKLCFPSDKKSLKEMLHFLAEDYLLSTVTGDHFLSNSKRWVSGPTPGPAKKAKRSSASSTKAAQAKRRSVRAARPVAAAH